MFPLQFNLLPEKQSFLAYRDRLQGREAYRRANALDDEKAEEMGLNAPQQAQPQPA
jgi:hypothetical protein